MLEQMAHPLDGPRFCGVRENWQVWLDFLHAVHEDVSFSAVASQRIYCVSVFRDLWPKSTRSVC